MKGYEVEYATLFAALKKADQSRQSKCAIVRKVRRGQLNDIIPGMFPENWPAPITANIIDSAAQDVGEILGELPTIRCRPTGSSRAQAEKSAKRTKIAVGYIDQSGLQRNMPGACDRFVTYGTLPFVVEPDFAVDGPVIRIASSVNTLYRKNLRGEVTAFYEYWKEPRSSLEAKFPDIGGALRTQSNFRVDRVADSEDDPDFEVVQYYGPDEFILFVPERDGLVLRKVANPLGKVPVAVAELPQWDTELHGTYENAVWVQLARARMALFTMQATDESINAPLAVPPDVTKAAIGPNAVIRSSNPGDIRRVPIDVPREAWVQSGSLEREERIAARYPEGRSGNIQASVITGQGVDALMGGAFDQRINTLQMLVAFELRRAVSFAFELDEKVFGKTKKVIAGVINGKKFETDYVPEKDIAGDYSVDVTYGFMAGMDPNRATVMMLQLLGAGLVDKTTVQESLPFQIDVDDVNERLDRQAVEDALRSGVQSMLANVGALAAQGQNPTDLLQKAASLVTAREKGKSLTEAVLEVFKVEEQPQQDPFAPQAPAGPGGPPAAPSPQQPGGIMQMLSQLRSSGEPSMATRVMQQQPVA